MLKIKREELDAAFAALKCAGADGPLLLTEEGILIKSNEKACIRYDLKQKFDAFCAVSFMTLRNVVNTLSGDVSFEANDTNLLVSGSGSKSKIALIDKEVVPPDAPVDYEIEVKTKDFVAGLKSVTFAAANSVESSNKMAMLGVTIGLAKDSYKLTCARNTLIATTSGKPITDNEKATGQHSVSIEFADILNRCTGTNTKIGVADKWLVVTSDKLVAKVAKFVQALPNFDRLLKQPVGFQVTCNVEALKNSLARAECFTEKLSPDCNATFSEKSLQLKVSSSVGEGESEIDSTLTTGKIPEENIVGISPGELQSILEKLSNKDVKLTIADSKSFLTIDEGNKLFLNSLRIPIAKK